MVDIIYQIMKLVVKLNPGMVEKADERLRPVYEFALFSAQQHNKISSMPDETQRELHDFKQGLETCISNWNDYVLHWQKDGLTRLKLIQKDEISRLYALPKSPQMTQHNRTYYLGFR